MAAMNIQTPAIQSVAVVALLVAAALGGCAGGGGGDEGARTQARGADGVRARGGQALIDAQAAMARCMRAHGVEMPDPRAGGGFELDPGEGGMDERRMRAAERKCARQRRAIAQAAPPLSAPQQARARDLTLRYARCMRDNGADVPDPRVSGEDGGMAVEVPAGAKGDPAFQRAAGKCERLLRG